MSQPALVMTMRDHQDTCTSSPRLAAVVLAIGSLGWMAGGCVLSGIEPDEIDIADGTTGLTGDGDGDAGGDGDGDQGTGDGDGDTTGSGEGDGDPTGDGDGDATTTGDGDGDPSSDVPCADFGPVEVFDGENPIVVSTEANSFAGSCGGVEGPDGIFVYEATTEGLITFTLDQPEFDGVIYLVGELCDPLDEWVCDAQSVDTLMTVGQAVYIVVDSNQAEVGGAANLTITGP